MLYDQKYLLGVSVDTVTPAEAIEQIIGFIANYQQDQQPRYIAAVDTTALVEINNWHSPHLRNREVAGVLRHATLALCTSQRLARLSAWLESPGIKPVITQEFIPSLAKALEQHQYSLYLLGTNEQGLKNQIMDLQQACPHLNIANLTATTIAIRGDGLLEAPERDALLIEQINQAKPSVLLLNLDTPTAEMWFARVATQLKVPLTIGLTDSFATSIPWQQRLCQSAQLGYMALPAICYHRFSHLMYKLYYSHWNADQNPIQTRLFVSNTRTIAFLELPTLLDLSHPTVYSAIIDQAFSQDHLVVDFRHVRHITLRGISFLIALWQRAQSAQKEFSGLALNGDMRLLLKLHRAWDSIGLHQYSTVQDLLASRQQARYNTLYNTLEQNEYAVIASFFGPLDNRQDYDRLFQQLAPIIKERHCTLDFTYCTVIEGRGCSFLLVLQKYLGQHGKRLRLYGLSEDLKSQLESAQLLPLLTVQSTRPSLKGS